MQKRWDPGHPLLDLPEPWKYWFFHWKKWFFEKILFGKISRNRSKNWIAKTMKSWRKKTIISFIIVMAMGTFRELECSRSGGKNWIEKAWKFWWKKKHNFHLLMEVVMEAFKELDRSRSGSNNWIEEAWTSWRSFRAIRWSVTGQ